MLKENWLCMGGKAYTSPHRIISAKITQNTFVLVAILIEPFAIICRYFQDCRSGDLTRSLVREKRLIFWVIQATACITQKIAFSRTAANYITCQALGGVIFGKKILTVQSEGDTRANPITDRWTALV